MWAVLGGDGMSRKFVGFLIAMVAAFALATAYFWWQGNVSDAQYERLKLENKQKLDALDQQVREAKADSATKVAENEALRGQVRQLAAQYERMKLEVDKIRVETDKKLKEIQTLSPQERAKQTTEYLELPPLEVRSLIDGSLVFTEKAGRTNLEHLVIGDATKKELVLANQRMANLEEQLKKERQESGNKDEIIKNKDRELLAKDQEMQIKLGEKDKEIQVVKAKARKRNVMVGVLGFVGGVLVKAFGF